MYQALSRDNRIVGQGNTAIEAIQAAQTNGYSASDVLIRQVGTSGGLIST